MTTSVVPGPCCNHQLLVHISAFYKAKIRDCVISKKIVLLDEAIREICYCVTALYFIILKWVGSCYSMGHEVSHYWTVGPALCP